LKVHIFRRAAKPNQTSALAAEAKYLRA